MKRIAVLAAAFLLAAGFARAGQKAPPRAGTEGNGVWSSHAFVYDGAGNITAIGDDAYVYDSAGRLVRGTANGPNNRQDYAYDSFGNRLRADTIGAPCAGTVTCGGIADVDWRTNRLRDHNAGYDDAGNLTRYDPKFDPANPSQSHPFAYAYDGAGMVSNITAPDNVRYEYVYTVDDERLAINTNGGNWRFTVRDLAGRVIREVNAYVGSNGTTWLWDRDHVFRDTAPLATISATGTQQFHLDHLGTPRVVTDATGGQLGMHTYYPYGEELNLGPQENPEERLKFTGHERDAVGSGGLDYMHARYYASNLGRFLSVDPELNAVDASKKPQAWNRYTYGENNPANRIDSDGRQAAIPQPFPGPMAPWSLALYHVQQMQTNEAYQRSAVETFEKMTEVGKETTVFLAMLGVQAVRITAPGLFNKPAESRNTPQIGRGQPRPNEQYKSPTPPNKLEPGDPNKQPPPPVLLDNKKAKAILKMVELILKLIPK
jgi:RHS repeat-associated protein